MEDLKKESFVAYQLNEDYYEIKENF